ncbi:hypothetical protein ANN_01596 [Periplaneta americana]|uniref:Uncharacterized protein n=1 Tax=Periplaneta americana TaxID=6978 RepID=A0ABQ8TU17_PERAM|nr:hypothetical protein ANN_01596 [Periplaneta americana]
MAGLCEGSNEPVGSLKAIRLVDSHGVPAVRPEQQMQQNSHYYSPRVTRPAIGERGSVSPSYLPRITRKLKIESREAFASEGAGRRIERKRMKNGEGKTTQKNSRLRKLPQEILIYKEIDR